MPWRTPEGRWTILMLILVLCGVGMSIYSWAEVRNSYNWNARQHDMSREDRMMLHEEVRDNSKRLTALIEWLRANIDSIAPAGVSPPPASGQGPVAPGRGEC